VVLLLLETLKQAGIRDLHLDVGHVGIFRALEHQAQLDAVQGRELFELLQSKDVALEGWVQAHVPDPGIGKALAALPSLAGSTDVLATAREVLGDCPATVTEALEQLSELVEMVQQRTEGVDIYLDLSELRGYHYHTGLVFAAY
ncbi:MAG TPA: ATP phosphoribosyltransferase regulatory subunit, partial [Porticoccaceae bacterium]|nr:ATP phosphoribosyltransferase regulatory subunit [Porticoccaceae bacterium]